MYIFKENLKVLLGCSVDQLWAKLVSQDRLDNIILKEMYKGPVDEIKEVEDENLISESISFKSKIDVNLLDDDVTGE